MTEDNDQTLDPIPSSGPSPFGPPPDPNTPPPGGEEGGGYQTQETAPLQFGNTGNLQNAQGYLQFPDEPTPAPPGYTIQPDGILIPIPGDEAAELRAEHGPIGPPDFRLFPDGHMRPAYWPGEPPAEGYAPEGYDLDPTTGEWVPAWGYEYDPTTGEWVRAQPGDIPGVEGGDEGQPLPGDDEGYEVQEVAPLQFGNTGNLQTAGEGGDEGQPPPGDDEGGIPGMGVPYRDFIPTIPMVQDSTTGEWRNAEPGEIPGVEGDGSPPPGQVHFDPATDHWVDPNTGQVLDTWSGSWYDPETGWLPPVLEGAPEPPPGYYYGPSPKETGYKLFPIPDDEAAQLRADHPPGPQFRLGDDGTLRPQSSAASSLAADPLQFGNTGNLEGAQEFQPSDPTPAGEGEEFSIPPSSAVEVEREVLQTGLTLQPGETRGEDDVSVGGSPDPGGGFLGFGNDPQDVPSDKESEGEEFSFPPEVTTEMEQAVQRATERTETLDQNAPTPPDSTIEYPDQNEPPVDPYPSAEAPVPPIPPEEEPPADAGPDLDPPLFGVGVQEHYAKDYNIPDLVEEPAPAPPVPDPEPLQTLDAALFDPGLPGPTLDPDLFDPNAPGPTITPNLLDASAEGPTIDPALLDPASPGPTVDANLLDPNAPGETVDPALLDPSAYGPTLDPNLLEQGIVEPGVAADPYLAAYPADTSLAEPYTADQDVQDQGFEGF